MMKLKSRLADDITVDTFRASGAGGQHINKTESGQLELHITYRYCSQQPK